MAHILCVFLCVCVCVLCIEKTMNKSNTIKYLTSSDLLWVTLEKLTTEELKRFQSFLTTGLPGYPPIPESQLKNADREKTVDLMVEKYKPEGAEKITKEILRKMNRRDLVKDLIIRGNRSICSDQIVC